MVRTKASISSVRVAGAKAPRKSSSVPSPSASQGKKQNIGCGGNPYCPRETPKWQKEITSFFSPTDVYSEKGEMPVDAEGRKVYIKSEGSTSAGEKIHVIVDVEDNTVDAGEKVSEDVEEIIINEEDYSTEDGDTNNTSSDIEEIEN